MSENTNNKNVRDDEIDLLDLFRRMGNTIGKWLKALGRAFLISIVFLLRKWLPLGLSLVAGVGVSLLMKSTSESFFTSDLTLKSNATTSEELISYINKLHTYCLESNSEALSGALSINPELAGNIIDISAFWIIDQNKDRIPDYVDYKNNHSVYDTTNIRMQDRLDIRAIIKSTQELSTVRDGIITFVNCDSLFQQKNRLRLRQSQELLARYDYDILQLDSLQKLKLEETKVRQPQTGGQMIFLQEQKTQLLYNDIYTLYSRKQNLETQNTLYKDIVTVLSDFSEPAKRDNGGMYYGKRVIPIFFFLTLLILILLANHKKLKEVYNKY
ncbi:MAG TPA: hypothetical protein VMV77_13475 [Bacteroidales bacterium]|nr:hypothetical protein [Bacteroidales bacterium]